MFNRVNQHIVKSIEKNFFTRCCKKAKKKINFAKRRLPK